MSRYSVHPIDKDFLEWDRKQKEMRNHYWAVLKRVRIEEYLVDNKGNYDLTSRPTFHYFMEQKYGIKMGVDGSGEYTSDYTVSDPKKFMILQIRYGL